MGRTGGQGSNRLIQYKIRDFLIQKIERPSWTARLPIRNSVVLPLRNSFSAGTILVSFVCLFLVVGGMYWVNSRREASLLIPETQPAASVGTQEAAPAAEPPEAWTGWPLLAAIAEQLPPLPEAAGPESAPLPGGPGASLSPESPGPSVAEGSPALADAATDEGPEGRALSGAATLSPTPPVEAEGAEAGDAPTASETPEAPTPETASGPLPEDAGKAAENAAPESSGESVVETEWQAVSLEGDSPSEPAVVSGVIARGDSASELLAPYLSANSVQQLLNASQKVHPLSKIRIGQPYTLVRTPDGGGMERFEYEINDLKKLIVTRTEDGLVAHVEPIVYDFQLVRVGGTIRSSLFETLASTGESPILAVRIADIFGSEINFIKDLREGDSFSLLIEKRYRDDAFKGYGKVLGATFTNQGKRYEAYLFDVGDGGEAFYNAKGESLKKTLLKAPLAFTRISSGYSMNRKHPIFKTHKPHQGVDYAAPSGTPVKAVGDGVVTRAGWGKGFGNMVVLKHSGGLESMYSHLSGFASGTKKGTRVRQGQVIGYVGATGYATGPHLDFRLKQNGKYINPSKVVAPRGSAVPRGRMAAFARQKDRVGDYLAGRRDLGEYRR